MKSSLHGSRWLILIGFLKIIGCRLPELSIYKGRLKSKKAACTTCFPCSPLNPNSHPVLSPVGESQREGNKPQGLYLGRLGVLGKVAAIRGMPSPQPSPTGEGAGCSRFKRCRSSEKECLKYQRQEFFRQPLSQGRWNKRRERFFRRPLSPSVGCVPQGARGGLGLQRKWRTRACVPHTPYMRATACYVCYELCGSHILTGANNEPDNGW